MSAPSMLKDRQISERKSKRDLKTLLDIVEPKLMVNRSIRSFLANYNVRQWQQVIKYLLVYGTATLQQQHGNQILTVEELKELSRTAQARVVFNNGIPALSDALEQMRTQLYDFEREIDMNKIDLKESKAAGKPARKKEKEPETTEAAKEEAPLEVVTEVVAPKTPSLVTPKPTKNKTKREDPRDTVREKIRRRHLYGATKTKTVKAKPSSDWRMGDDLDCPNPEEEDCHGDDEEYNPYPKWWEHPKDVTSFKAGSGRDASSLGFALPCLSSYVHNPFITEEDQPYPDQDALDVYDYMHARGPDTPFVPKAKPSRTFDEETTEEEEGEGLAKDEYTSIDASVTGKLPRQQQQDNNNADADTQVQKSMGDFYNDHWMKFFVDKHSGSTEAFERMNWSVAGSSHQEDEEDQSAEGSAAAVLSELTKPLSDKLEFSSRDFNEVGEEGDDRSKGNWKYLKGKEIEHGGWVGEYDLTKKGRTSIKDWVKANQQEEAKERPSKALTRGGVKWDFDDILAL